MLQNDRILYFIILKRRHLNEKKRTRAPVLQAHTYLLLVDLQSKSIDSKKKETSDLHLLLLSRLIKKEGL